MKKSNQINIYGANGHAKVVIDCILSTKEWEIGYAFDDNSAIDKILDYAVCVPKNIEKLKEFPVVYTIGNNEIRKKLAQKTNVKIALPIIHATAVISSYSSIEAGTVIMAGAIINAGVQIGAHAIINTGAIIEHDCILQDYVHISPNAALAGEVNIGEGSHIGIGAQVIQGIKIGKWSTIGAGAVIIKDVPDGATVVGNPGRRIK